MPDSFVGVPPDSTGKKLRTRQRVIGANTVDEQYMIPVSDRVTTYGGRAATFQIPGRAGTAGQSLMQISNATGSGVIVAVERFAVDVLQTAIMAVTQVPPIIRLHKGTGALTGGAALTKVAENTLETSNANVTLLQDASADGTLATTALAAAIPAGTIGHLTQEWMPRLITAAGYEMADRFEFLDGDDDSQLIHPGQHMFLRLAYTAAAANPASNLWLATIRWSEFTIPEERW
jgi:hypothetical protein